MTEKEFLEKRTPIWLEGEDLHISTPSNMDKNDMHVFLCKKYGYNALFAIRGYYWPGSHVVLYIGEYETPNSASSANEINIRRKGFYKRNGFCETGYFTFYDDTEFEIGCAGMEFDAELFRQKSRYVSKNSHYKKTTNTKT